MRRVKNNSFLHIGEKAARSKGKRPDGYYAHMDVKKGFSGVTPDKLRKMICYVKKQINRLSIL